MFPSSIVDEPPLNDLQWSRNSWVYPGSLLRLVIGSRTTAQHGRCDSFQQMSAEQFFWQLISHLSYWSNDFRRYLWDQERWTRNLSCNRGSRSTCCQFLQKNPNVFLTFNCDRHPACSPVPLSLVVPTATCTFSMNNSSTSYKSQFIPDLRTDFRIQQLRLHATFARAKRKNFTTICINTTLICCHHL